MPVNSVRLIAYFLTITRRINSLKSSFSQEETGLKDKLSMLLWVEEKFLATKKF